jgi:hypothetical protein
MKKPIKAIVTVILLAAIVAAGVIFVPRLANTCDNCGKFFLGSGYTANVVSNTLTTLTGQDDKILCKECAAKEHALAIAAGKSLDDFKRPLFEAKEEK